VLAAAPRLAPGPRLALLSDLIAAVAAGDVALDAALRALPAIVKRGTPPEQLLAARLVDGARPWVPAAARPRFARWVARTFAGARALGLTPRADDDVVRERQRGELVPLLAETGGDRALRTAAVAAARDWRRLPLATRAMVLWLAVRADPAVHDGLLAAFRDERDRVVRRDLARALGSVADPDRLAAALALTLDPAIDIRDSVDIIYAATTREDTRPTVEAFVRANADALLARLPVQLRSGMIGWLTSGCDAAAVADAQAFADAKLAALPGARRRIDQSLERLRQCVARARWWSRWSRPGPPRSSSASAVEQRERVAAEDAVDVAGRRAQPLDPAADRAVVVLAVGAVEAVGGVGAVQHALGADRGHRVAHQRLVEVRARDVDRQPVVVADRPPQPVVVRDAGVREDQPQPRRRVDQHPPRAAVAEAEVDQDRQAQLLAALRDRDGVGHRPAVPVRVQLDADHPGHGAPPLELVEADRRPRVQEDPAEEAVGVRPHHRGHAGVVGPRVDRVGRAAQPQIAAAGDRRLGDGLGQRVAGGAHQPPHDRQQPPRGLGQRVVHAGDQGDPPDPALVELSQHRRHVKHPRLVVGVDVDDGHPRSMPERDRRRSPRPPLRHVDHGRRPRADSAHGTSVPGR
jgi:hypothetical protein